MQLSFSFSLLLVGILTTFISRVVNATPVQDGNGNGGIVTLPLRRVESTSSIHPQVDLQQHINRAVRRLAYITGDQPPTRRELAHLLRRRLESLDIDLLERRFSRFGVPNSSGASSSLLELKGNKGKNRQPQAASLVTNANAPTAPDSLGLDIEAQDVGYLATVQIGTPPRDFLILMDSGSADFWVGAENCQSEGGGGCGNHKFLGQQSSSTFQDTGNQFQVTYGTGNVQGDIITDDVSIAGLSLPKHTFGVATQESVDFSSNSVPFDGLMGLAQSTLAQQGTPTPVDSLTQAGLIKEAIVSFKISRVADNNNDGEITFGGLDSSKFDSNTLVTLPNVNQNGFWEAAVDAATLNGADLGLTGRTAILDTGTTLIIMPAADAAAVHKQIPGAQSDGQGGFTLPCTGNVTLAFTFGGQPFAIDPRDLAFQPLNANDPQGNCVSGIASGNIGGATEWLVGDVFLKNAYFSTDSTKNTVALAKLV